MRCRRFVDTNIFVYAYTGNDAAKHDAAGRLLRNELRGCDIVISTQVLSEFYAAMTKNRCPHERVIACVSDIVRGAETAGISLATIQICIGLKEKYGYSWWDSLILASALENGCDVVYSEDMKDGQFVEGALLIKNPFKT